MLHFIIYRNVASVCKEEVLSTYKSWIWDVLQFKPCKLIKLICFHLVYLYFVIQNLFNIAQVVRFVAEIHLIYIFASI